MTFHIHNFWDIAIFNFCQFFAEYNQWISMRNCYGIASLYAIWTHKKKLYAKMYLLCLTLKWIFLYSFCYMPKLTKSSFPIKYNRLSWFERIIRFQSGKIRRLCWKSPFRLWKRWHWNNWRLWQGIRQGRRWERFQF